MFNGSGGDNKRERKKWWSMEVIMSMCGVPMEVSGSEWKVSKLVFYAQSTGVVISVREWKVNAVKTEVYENEKRRIQWRWRCLHVTLKAITFFVVQPTGSAPDSTWSAQTGNVSARIMCVTAMPNVVTVLTKETAVSWCLWQWWWWWWW